MNLRSFVAVLGVVLVAQLTFSADTEFDHFEGTPDIDSLEIDPDSSAFLVQVHDTCPEFFIYGAQPLIAPTAAAVNAAPPANPTGLDLFKLSRDCETQSHEFAVAHKPEHAGYVVHVQLDPKRGGAKVRAFRRKANVTDAAIAAAFDRAVQANSIDPSTLSSQTPEKLNKLFSDFGEYRLLGDDELVVHTEPRSPWAFEFAAGPTASKLTDPVFSIQNGIVVEDSNAEDDYELGIAAFVHVANRRWVSWLSPLSLGLGISDSNSLNLLAGPSLRFGDFGKSTGYLTAGVNVGPVNRLPSGQSLGQPPISENVLSDLPTQTNSAMFIAVSFSFFGNARGAFGQRFQDVGSKGDDPK